jgi:hypothetical protein
MLRANRGRHSSHPPTGIRWTVAVLCLLFALFCIIQVYLACQGAAVLNKIVKVRFRNLPTDSQVQIDSRTLSGPDVGLLPGQTYRVTITKNGEIIHDNLFTPPPSGGVYPYPGP